MLSNHPKFPPCPIHARDSLVSALPGLISIGCTGSPLLPQRAPVCRFLGTRSHAKCLTLRNRTRILSILISQDLLCQTKREAPLARRLSQKLEFLRLTSVVKSECRSVLRRRRRLHAFPSVPLMPALHLCEGWIRSEEQRGWRLPDVGQLI